MYKRRVDEFRRIILRLNGMRKNETCLYCNNRLNCDKYKNWLNDKSNIHPPLVKNCNKYEEEKFDRNIEKYC